MNKTHPELGRAFVFAGLTAALALGIIGSCCYCTQKRTKDKYYIKVILL